MSLHFCRGKNIHLNQLPMPYSTFSTEIIIRPDDIDMNQHLHSTRYLDYVLTARFDQMGRCYGMSMEEFIKLGYSWVNTKTYVEYKREMKLGDTAVVFTHLDQLQERGCIVQFEIRSKATNKVCCNGWCEFVMVSIETGRSVIIPDFIIEKYSV